MTTTEGLMRLIAIGCLVAVACASAPRSLGDPDGYTYQSDELQMTRRASYSVDSAWADGWMKRVEVALCAPSGSYLYAPRWDGKMVLTVTRFVPAEHVAYRDSVAIFTWNNALMCPEDAVSLHTHIVRWVGHEDLAFSPSDVDSATARRMSAPVHIIQVARWWFVVWGLDR